MYATMLVVLSLKCSYIWECPHVLPLGVEIQFKPMWGLCTMSNRGVRQDGMLTASKNHSKSVLPCLTRHVPHCEASLCHQIEEVLHCARCVLAPCNSTKFFVHCAFRIISVMPICKNLRCQGLFFPLPHQKNGKN